MTLRGDTTTIPPAYLEGTALILSRMQLSEGRIWASYRALEELRSLSGPIPQELITSYNEMRDQFVNMALPLAQHAAEVAGNKDAKFVVPPKWVEKAGLAGVTANARYISMSSLQAVVPELPASKLASGMYPTMPLEKSTGGMLVVLLLGIVVGVAVAWTYFGPSYQAKVNDSQRLDVISKARSDAVEVYTQTYKSCAETTQTTEGRMDCAKSAGKVAVGIANSGGVELTADSWGFLQYFGLFALIGVGVAGYYFYRRAQQQRQLAPAY